MFCYCSSILTSFESVNRTISDEVMWNMWSHYVSTLLICLHFSIFTWSISHTIVIALKEILPEIPYYYYMAIQEIVFTNIFAYSFYLIIDLQISPRNLFWFCSKPHRNLLLIIFFVFFSYINDIWPRTHSTRASYRNAYTSNWLDISKALDFNCANNLRLWMLVQFFVITYNGVNSNFSVIINFEPESTGSKPLIII